MENEHYIDFARDLIYRGADHLEVQEALRSRQRSKEDISRIMIILESDFVKYQLAEQERSKVLNQFFVGLFVVVIGLGMTGYGILTTAYQQKILYGLIVAGAWWALRNWLRFRQPVEDFIPREVVHRRRRFKKRF